MTLNSLKCGVVTVTLGFLRNAALPRIKEIIFTQDSLIAVAFGLSAFHFSNSIFTHAATLSDMAAGFVGYAAIALGFCVGGITIALTLPDKEFISRLAHLKIGTKEGDALSSLLFVFVWTAFVHWCSIALALAFLLFCGNVKTADLLNSGLTPRIILGAGVMIATYTLLQFLITALTLWQAGSMYISNLRTDASNDSQKTDEHPG